MLGQCDVRQRKNHVQYPRLRQNSYSPYYYSPEAVLIKEEGSEKLYFIVESKGSLFTFDRRGSENAKIDCGKAHFEAIGNDVHFAVASSYDNFVENF